MISVIFKSDITSTIFATELLNTILTMLIMIKSLLIYFYKILAPCSAFLELRKVETLFFAERNNQERSSIGSFYLGRQSQRQSHGFLWSPIMLTEI
jgi:hypothetical protein